MQRHSPAVQPKPRSIDLGGHVVNVYPLDHGAELLLVPGFLSSAEKRLLLNESKRYPWERQRVMGVQTLRSNAWFAEASNAIYKFSGQRWVPVPLTAVQIELRDRLTAILGARMDSVLATHYPHGGASVGWHADDEPLFGNNPTIASISVGTTRVFQISDKTRAGKGRADIELPLEDGDLVVMRGPFQHHYRHAVKKASRNIGPRLNLSYRRVALTA